MTLKETGLILEKYRKIELEIDLLRQQQSDIQKYIHDTKEADDQIARIKANAEDALLTEEEDYQDIKSFLSAVIEGKKKKEIPTPKESHSVHDEFFINSYENYKSYRVVLNKITLAFVFLMVIGAALCAILIPELVLRIILPAILVLIPLLPYFLFKRSFIKGLKRLSITQLEAMNEKHDLIVSKVKEEATEKIDRIKYQIEQEYEKRAEEKLADQEKLNNKILSLRKDNSELGIPINVMQMYDSLKYRDLFVSLLKNAEPNDTLIGVWGALKLQEELYKINNQLYDTNILLGKKDV